MKEKHIYHAPPRDLAASDAESRVHGPFSRPRRDNMEGKKESGATVGSGSGFVSGSESGSGSRIDVSRSSKEGDEEIHTLGVPAKSGATMSPVLGWSVAPAAVVDSVVVAEFSKEEAMDPTGGPSSTVVTLAVRWSVSAGSSMAWPVIRAAAA